MKKRILITGGPTAEPIDEVMRVITFSTGGLSVRLADHFLSGGDAVTLIVNPVVRTETLAGKGDLTVIEADSTRDMMAAVEAESKGGQTYDALLHTAAVGDYQSDFVFLLEDMAQEIFARSQEKPFTTAEEILHILKDPACRLDDSSKISSYQENLTVKLGLTPKIIGNLRDWFPDTLLIGCKLLENVPKEELYEAAQTLCRKNRLDYVMANDLAELNRGNGRRVVVTADGFNGTVLDDPAAIAVFVKKTITA